MDNGRRSRPGPAPGAGRLCPGGGHDEDFRRGKRLGRLYRRRHHGGSLALGGFAGGNPPAIYRVRYFPLDPGVCGGLSHLHGKRGRRADGGGISQGPLLEADESLLGLLLYQKCSGDCSVGAGDQCGGHFSHLYPGERQAASLGDPHCKRRAGAAHPRAGICERKGAFVRSGKGHQSDGGDPPVPAGGPAQKGDGAGGSTT